MTKQTFNIKKKGNNFVAFDTIDKTRSYGSINIKTNKFTGDTRCLIALNEHLDKHLGETLEPLIDKVLDRIKEDVSFGDMTAIDELLRFLPTDILKGYLSEN